MGVEDEIEDCFKQGYNAQQIINKGFKKSTVYKVYQTIKSYSMPVNPPQWSIEDINPWILRYQPGQNASINFSFKNSSDRDIYLHRVGLRLEWMADAGQWIAQEVRDLVKPNQKKYFSFIIPVPMIPLGEYEMLFGAEIQYLPANDYSDISKQTQWTEPLIFHIKLPVTGTIVFISHSTLDIQIVRELEKRLDNQGIQTRVEEDIPEPGSVLEDKFKKGIQESTIVLTLLTENSVRSKWVIMETEFAKSISKPIIPLKEKNLRYEGPIEWVEFSRSDSPDIIFGKVMDAIRRTPPQISPIGAVIGIGILAFLAAAIFGDSK